MHSRNCSPLTLFPLLILAILIPCSDLPGQRPRQPLQFPAPPPRGKQAGKVERPAVLKMRVEEGRVTADITDSPLRSVLQELAERTGIIFEVRDQDNPQVSIHLDRVPLEEAIQRITSGRNAVFLYGQDAESDRITLVRVYPRTAPVPQPGLVYLGTGAVTKTNNAVETPEQALEALAGNAGVEDREIAIEILVKTKEEAAIKALMNCLSDPAPEIRVAAIEGLAALGARAALPGILKNLKDSHPGVRQTAATAVSLLGDAGNVKDLKPLSADKDSTVAAAAEIAIRKLSAAGKR